MKFNFLKAAIAGMIMVVSGAANAGLMLTVTAEGEGDANKAASLVTFTIDYASVFDNNVNYLDTLSITLGGKATSPAGPDDDFSNFHFVSNTGGAPIPHDVSFYGGKYGANTIYFDFDDTFFDATESFTFDVFVTNACTNADGVKCDDVGMNWNSGAILGHLGSTMSATFANGDEAGTYERTFRTTSDSTSVAQVPEPTTLAIFVLGIMGLAARRFKKQA